MPDWTDDLFRDEPGRFAETLADRADDAGDEVDSLLALLDDRGRSPDSVLDVACGIGRHVVPFAAAGLDAEGLDYSEPFVERARARASEAGVDDRTAFHHADMRDLDGFDGEYDLVTLFWNSLGYYGREVDRAVLSDARSLLSEDGTLVVEASNKDHVVHELDGDAVHDRGDELIVRRVEYDPETGRHHQTVERFAADGDGYEHAGTTEFSPRLYAPVELRELCEAAGYDRVSLEAGFDGGEVTLSDPRVVVLAE
jgi:SAM-dependent methyltransferase